MYESKLLFSTIYDYVFCCFVYLDVKNKLEYILVLWHYRPYCVEDEEFYLSGRPLVLHVFILYISRGKIFFLVTFSF